MVSIRDSWSSGAFGGLIAVKKLAMQEHYCS